MVFYLKGQSHGQLGPVLARGGNHNVTVWDDATLLVKRRAAGFCLGEGGNRHSTTRLQAELFQVNLDPIRIQGFDDQKLKEKNTADNFFIAFF